MNINIRKYANKVIRFRHFVEIAERRNLHIPTYLSLCLILAIGRGKQSIKLSADNSTIGVIPEINHAISTSPLDEPLSNFSQRAY